MKTRSYNGDTYRAPELSVIEISTEGILCASEGSWYERGGQGDFDFDTDTDNQWGY